MPLETFYHRELTLTLTYSSSPADLAEAFRLIAAGALDLEGLYTHRLALDRLGEGVELMRDSGRRQGLRDAMRAVVFHGPGDLRYEDVPWPEPGPGEMVLRIEAALTCGTDVKVRRRGHPVMIPRVPTVFGHEFAGTIAAVGAGVVGWREGERVVAANSAPCGQCRLCLAGRPNLCEDLLFVNGAYGEAIALPPASSRSNLVRLSPALPAARAAFAEPLACALRRIERARLEAGQSVVDLRPRTARLPARHGRRRPQGPRGSWSATGRRWIRSGACGSRGGLPRCHREPPTSSGRFGS